MKTVSTIRSLRHELADFRHSRKTVGFVPTMGALHDGHLSLVRAAKQRCDVVVVSVFVNPTQFGPNEDFAKYPRTLENDSALLERDRADLVFTPSVEEIYPAGATTLVTVEGLSERLDGKSRPGHFRGVATVVSKLLNSVQPDVAFFGQKDAAQLAIIRRMVRDLAIPVEIVGCPIVREPDGLAMSSRNVYLSPQERQTALVLNRSLQTALSVYGRGEREAAALRGAGMQVLAAESGLKLDYLEIVNADTLEPVTRAEKGTLVAVAGWVGATRLIDNVLLP